MKKGIKIAVALVFGLLIMGCLITLVVYPADYVGRVLRWGNADVYDYQKFPERPLPASSTPLQFKSSDEADQVQAVFNGLLTEGDLETFLEETGTQAFIVIQDDTILYENYFNGADRETIVTSFSTAKSFTSALIGIAISEGHIHSVEDPITDYLPELAEHDPEFNNITIRDLLMMSSGIKYEEFPFFNGDDAKTYYYPDLHDLALNQTEIAGQPGETFLYNNYHPLLLGLILERATGMNVADYLAEKIWQPMGAVYDGSWSLDEHGFEKMESGINGRAIDFAKFGSLYLHEGMVNGEQVVPTEWVQESTSVPTAVPDGYFSDWFTEALPNGYYKYMWWGLQRDGQANDFTALGNHGQFNYISPHKNLIIVRHGEQYGVELSDWLNLFYDFASEWEPTE